MQLTRWCKMLFKMSVFNCLLLQIWKFRTLPKALKNIKLTWNQREIYSVVFMVANNCSWRKQIWLTPPCSSIMGKAKPDKLSFAAGLPEALSWNQQLVTLETKMQTHKSHDINWLSWNEPKCFNIPYCSWSQTSVKLRRSWSGGGSQRAISSTLFPVEGVTFSHPKSLHTIVKDGHEKL